MTHAADAAYPPVERAERTAGPGVPDRRLFWQWVWSAVRPVLGWVLAAAGVIALFAGWYGVSGEALTAKQLPYLVSGGLSGVGLLVLAAAFLATEDFRRQIDRIDGLETKIDDLHRLFAAEFALSSDAGTTATAASEPGATAPLPAVAARPTDPSGLVALPGGASYHRRDCTLVRGKTQAAAVDRATVQERSLRPCRICDPPRLG